MAQVQAFDVNGKELQEGQLVRIVTEPKVKHAWLRKGNVLRVSYWEERSFIQEGYIIVFLASKGEGKLCSIGIRDTNLEIVEDGEI